MNSQQIRQGLGIVTLLLIFGGIVSADDAPTKEFTADDFKMVVKDMNEAKVTDLLGKPTETVVITEDVLAKPIKGLFYANKGGHYVIGMSKDGKVNEIIVFKDKKEYEDALSLGKAMVINKIPDELKKITKAMPVEKVTEILGKPTETVDSDSGKHFFYDKKESFYLVEIDAGKVIRVRVFGNKATYDGQLEVDKAVRMLIEELKKKMEEDLQKKKPE